MPAFFIPTRVSDMQSDSGAATISVGTGGTGDLLIKTNSVESARFLNGSVGPPDTRGTLLFNHGDAQSVSTDYGVTTGRYLDMRHGASASPDTTYAPSVKLSRTFQHAGTTARGSSALNSATINATDTTGFASTGTLYIGGVATTYTGKTGGATPTFTGCGNHVALAGGETISDFPIVRDGAEQLAALSVNACAVNDSGVQPVGGYFGAFTDSTISGAGGGVSPDACAVYATAEIRAGGTGVAGAICAIARRNDTSAYALTTQQVFVKNSSSADQTYSPTAVSDCAFWINSNGAKNAGAGLLFARSTSQFDVGIGFMSGPAAGGSIKTAAIRDDSSAVTSYVINGSHTNGIDTSGGTFSGNPFVFGNNTAIASKLADGTVGELLKVRTGAAIALGSSTFGSVVLANTKSIGAFNAAASAAYSFAYVDASNNINFGDTTANSVRMLTDVAMTTHKLTGLSAGTANGDSVRYEQAVGAGLQWPLLGEQLKNVQAFGIGAGQTWTKPGVGSIALVIIRGAGGGGGGGVATASAGNARYGGNGGGSGGWCIFTVPLAALGSTAAVDVAIGGAGGTAGNAGGDSLGGLSSLGTTQFDTAGSGNCTTAANVTKATGGGAGGSSAPAASAGGTGTAPAYTGYIVTSAVANGAAGGASSNTTTAGSGSSGSGGAGGGVTTTPTGQTGGQGSNASNTGNASSTAATKGLHASSAMQAILTPANLNIVNGGGGGGGNDGGSSHNGGNGADGFMGGGGGGGGSVQTGGTAGAGGDGGDAFVMVLVY